MNGYLLDSDILIWYLRGNAEFVELVQGLAQTARLGCSVVSIMEVEAGMRQREEAKTIAFLDGLQDFPVEKAVARKAASYIREFKLQGVTLDFADCLIAATAGLNNLTLVTANLAHYPMTDVLLHTD